MWISAAIAQCLIAVALIPKYFAAETKDVRLPPSITHGPIKHYVYRENEVVKLQCIAYGIPEVAEYEWKKNGFDLNQNAPNIRRTGDGSIEINPITRLDEGYYLCIAKNLFGTALSNTSFLQMAIHSPNQATHVLAKSVPEGEPFFIQMLPVKSVPPPTFEWESAIDTVDRTPAPIALSKRVQVAENGDLYFAYAVSADDLGSKIYKCTAFNEYLDLRSGGSYTNITVNKVQGGPKPIPPVLGFSSAPTTIAVEGREVTIRCFFSGNPEPDIQWSGPKNKLPAGRYSIEDYNSKLTIKNVQLSDEGDYTCTGSNTIKRLDHTLQIKVEAKPTFLNPSDRPVDTNFTEGNSATFNCRPRAIPEATVTWYRNGVPIDLDSLPKRYAISNDRKTLTIQNLCRNCDDRRDTSQSDLVVIQCNASNVHGYVFAAGYVNVLTKTNVIMTHESDVEVEMNEERKVEFGCVATSDPLTPVKPKWYRESSKGREVVYEEPPVVHVNEGMLTIHVVPNNTNAWTRYDGKYICLANTSYSSAEVTAKITIKDLGETTEGLAEFPWWILLPILLLLLLLIIIVICCCCCMRNKGDKYDVDAKERKNGNDPEKELKGNDFQDYQRPEAQTLKGSRGSLGSAGKLNSDDETSLLEYGDDPGKFNEDGSFVGVYASNTAERGRGRRE